MDQTDKLNTSRGYAMQVVYFILFLNVAGFFFALLLYKKILLIKSLNHGILFGFSPDCNFGF